MYTIKVDGDKCLGCRLCAIVCDTEAIDVRSDVLAFAAAEEKCTGCNACADICPEKAITITEK
jgi:MinD superfamily P-loop ATPase containing an inserted ferredoxin domain